MVNLCSVNYNRLPAADVLMAPRCWPPDYASYECMVMARHLISLRLFTLQVQNSIFNYKFGVLSPDNTLFLAYAR